MVDWYKFETQCRSLVRHWGFEVGNNPVKYFNKELDICGPHILLYNPKLSIRKKIFFIGECKAWNTPINTEIIYAFSGYLTKFKEENIPFISAIFSKNGFQNSARDLAKDHSIQLFDERSIEDSFKGLPFFSISSYVPRKSLPNYVDVESFIAVIDSAVKLNKEEFTTSDLISLVSNHSLWNPKYNVSKWLGDMVMHACLFNFFDFKKKEKNKNLFSLSNYCNAFSQHLQPENYQFLDFLRFSAIRLPWIRESIFYLFINPNSNKTKISRNLKDFLPGFDEASLMIAFNIAEELSLIERESTRKYKISDFTKDILWKKSIY